MKSREYKRDYIVRRIIQIPSRLILGPFWRWLFTR